MMAARGDGGGSENESESVTVRACAACRQPPATNGDKGWIIQLCNGEIER
jgi:hypothetical protein